jgi:hypothetical protein
MVDKHTEVRCGTVRTRTARRGSSREEGREAERQRGRDGRDNRQTTTTNTTNKTGIGSTNSGNQRRVATGPAFHQRLIRLQQPVRLVRVELHQQSNDTGKAS